MEQTQYDAIIIGSGHNGLVTAGYLAKDGLSVLVLERQDVIGGACVTEELYPGFYVPYCADYCFLLQGKIIDDLELRDNGLDIIPLEYEHFHPFPDGNYLQMGVIAGYKEGDVSEVARFSEHDAKVFPQWRSFWERASSILYRYWLKEPPTLAQVFEDVRGTIDEEVLETMLTVSLRDLIERYFESDYVKAHYIDPVGWGDPSRPGSILPVAYELCAQFSRPQDVGIPRSGIGQITQSMAKFAQSHEAQIRTKARVEKIIVEDGIAKGVQLDSGEEIRSFIVVSNADPISTYLSMVGAEHLDDQFTDRVKHLTHEVGTVKFLAALKELPDFSSYLGKDYDPKRIAAMFICPSVDYCQQSWDMAKKGKPSTFPLMDIMIPSIYDSSLAPPGHHVFSNWVRYYPAELAEGSWEEEGRKVGEMVIDVMTQYAPNFRDSIIDWTAQSPKDIEIREAMPGGNVFHIDYSSEQIFARRMPYRSPIDRLYLCGSGTHPGGDISGAPGHNAAKAILKDLSKIAMQQPVA